MQVRSRLSKEFILFGLQLRKVQSHRFCCDIHVDELLTLHPAQVSADRGSGAADDFADTSVGEA